ncbi:AAA family ATPase [Psychromonas sp. SA13A]|uniref:AAA family ATPase n=1 Tax=Psychromonas sp. SA13A TaxID=2686346 RepID=UPI00140879D7|nr:AAA family ATPase [Psychromonas sp. SA13A]
MQLNIKISNVQHVKELIFSVDLTKNKLQCLVGKNGVGKTTLIRALKNIQSTDTFKKTASPYIFHKHSRIVYTIDNNIYKYEYHPQLKMIDSKKIIPKEIKDNIFVELPIPHGSRFSHFQSLGEIDDELRKSIPLENYTVPTELINFLSKIYDTDKFSALKEVVIKRKRYYFILKEDDYYIREDYLSSGEYFVISLFKMVQSRCKCIVIDEIDISLDSSAQINLLDELRILCDKYEINVIFTTHSLAIMRKLKYSELQYMESHDGIVSITNKSYNFIKSMLFGFKGWDKYIITEDEVLKNFIEYLLYKNGNNFFHKYIILYIGGSSNVADLVERNKQQNFFSTDENIMVIYDGDQSEAKFTINIENAECIPFESIEKELYDSYKTTPTDFPHIPKLQNQINQINKESKKGKRVFDALITAYDSGWSENDIFEYLIKKNPEEIQNFTTKIINFLSSVD